MDFTPVRLLLLTAAIAWWAVALVTKDGPWQVLKTIRGFVLYMSGGNKERSPLECQFCATFWVGLTLLLLLSIGNSYIDSAIKFFGLLGIANALRGLSGEY